MAHQRPSLAPDPLADVHVTLPPPKDRQLAAVAQDELPQRSRAKRDRLVQCSFRLPASQLDDLEDLNDVVGTSVSELVREAIANFLKSRG